jgi:hypothetical protein
MAWQTSIDTGAPSRCRRRQPRGCSIQAVEELVEDVGEDGEDKDFDMEAADSPTDSKRTMSKVVLKYNGTVSESFHDLGNKTLVETGWEPYTNHAKGVDGTRTVIGLNITSPAISTFSTVFFTKTTARNGMVSYRKPPRTLGKSSDLNAIGNANSKATDSYRIYLRTHRGLKAAPGGPPIGSKVRTILEVSPHNIPHAHSWLRLPTTCLLEDAPRAMTLAIRVEWKKPDQVESEYMVHNPFPLVFDTAPGNEGQYDGMGIAIGFLNYLEIKGIVGPPPKRSFIRDFGTARVLEATSDHLRQLVELRIVTDSPLLIKDAGPRTSNAIHQDLQNAGAQNINMQFRLFSTPTSHGHIRTK